MAAHPASRRQRNTPHHDTGQEALYLRFLSEKQVPVEVKLRDGEAVSGWIEYFDDSMIRLTREGKPNLFIYKAQIRTISEPDRREESKRRAAERKAAAAAVSNASVAAPASVAPPDSQAARHPYPDEQEPA